MTRRFLPLILFAILFIIITILADKALIPRNLKSIPYYDSVGHFVLFGIYAYFAQLAFLGKRINYLPVGAGLVVIYAFADEFLQKLSPNRSFDLSDLFFSLTGIIVATFIFYRLKK